MLQRWYNAILLSTCLILVLPQAVLGQETGTITGVVTDSRNQQTIPGANVLVAGTQTGTTTDENGEYTLEVEPGTYDIRVSFVGYANEIEEGIQVQANQTRTVNFQLEQAAAALDEVVVVGYGEQERRNVTGSVGSVDMSKVESQPITGLEQTLTSEVAGVRVSRTTGVPGGGADVEVRGLSSIGAGNDPLYVVDGFAIPQTSGQRTNPLNIIPPQQIKSIEVLKDASATSIYGSRGANGVILIETKEGTAETRVQVSSSVSYQDVRRRGMVDVLNAEEFAQFRKERQTDLFQFVLGRAPEPEEIPEDFRNPEELGTGTDWTEQVVEDAVSHNQSISVSGGNEDINAILTADITNQGGTIIGTDFNRYSFRSSINASISERLRVGLKLSPTLSDQELVNTDGVRGRGGVYGSTYIANPIVPVRDEEGELIPMIGGPGVLPFPNPVQQATKIKTTREENSVIANSFVEFEIIQGLNLRSTFGLLRTNETEERYVPSTVGDTFIPPPTVPEASDAEITSTNWSSETTLTYNETLGAHSFELLAGTTIQEDVTDISIFNATDFPDDQVREFGAAQTVDGVTAQQEWSLLSGFGRLIYDYDDKYLLTLSNRADGSSRFGENNRWGVFPSGSAGWRLSDESFMSGVDWLDNLLIRVGYGLTGNFRIGNFSQFGQVTRTDYVSGQERVAGRSVTGLGNPDLTWETVEQLNVGADISLLDEKYRISAEYYRNVSSDMLLSVRTPITSGFRQSLTNRGEVTNRGIELSLNTQLVETDDLSWNVNVNFSRNINKVTELDDQILSTSGAPKHVTREGSPVGMFYGFRVEGFYESEEEIDQHIPNGEAIPGAWRMRDVNDDGQIQPFDDFVQIGNPYPSFETGINTSVRYKNFDFSLSATGSYGGEKIQAGREDFWNMDGVFNVSAEVKDRWRSPENPGDGELPRAISTVTHRWAKSTWVEDASTLWIRNVNLGYTLNSSNAEYINSLGIRNMRVYASVNNLWISNTNFQNPDENLFPNDPLRPSTTRNLNHPISRSFTVGTNVSL